MVLDKGRLLMALKLDGKEGNGALMKRVSKLDGKEGNGALMKRVVDGVKSGWGEE